MKYPTLEQAAAQLREGQASAASLAETALARAADPASEGARVFTRRYPEQARAAAQAADTLRAAGLAWIAAVQADIAGHDALVLPTVPIVAPAIAPLQASDDAYYAANGAMLRNPTLINFLDGCALSLPCHEEGTAPVGLMIAGARDTDRRILSIGMAVEEMLAAD
ncbi:hypothetical protein CAL29_15480 [Bordetella genomosp. 10]|uniref:Uncharacterized protein n=1 Tax=Bordetella genomosp. 10 TaxID=1416804 RepID=A0A261SCR2_9BORD|nr:hypothetical protein CAL29_15480 [Bordetella genomosp. 10]